MLQFSHNRGDRGLHFSVSYQPYDVKQVVDETVVHPAVKA